MPFWRYLDYNTTVYIVAVTAWIVFFMLDRLTDWKSED